MVVVFFESFIPKRILGVSVLRFNGVAGFDTRVGFNQNFKALNQTSLDLLLRITTVRVIPANSKAKIRTAHQSSERL